MRLFSIALFCCLPVMCGCGGGSSDQPQLGTVSGQVTLAGKPLPNVVVTFSPVAKGRPSGAVSDEDGRYTLQYTANADGAMIGKHKVTAAMPDAGDSEPKEGETVTDTLPANASDGSMEKEVKEGSNTINIEL